MEFWEICKLWFARERVSVHPEDVAVNVSLLRVNARLESVSASVSPICGSTIS